MAKIKLKVPKLGLTIENVIITEWHKKEGDNIEAGELVATVEADKANFEIESPSKGTLTKIFYNADSEVEHEVGKIIAEIET
tara:strand:+ start:617 stop:862 length:246 start_codon:yes stop_codon:yes gene_type:complete